ncbi:hypothetical protein Tco_1110852 [Tanacetum coccineum]|uniref:Uncharacterized protein n=1 Tax=Tanacetum coccineum TaxID=301880 RepID=A0ABQ5IK73_9ASTR
MTVKDGVRDVHASCDYKGNEHGPHVWPHVTWDYGYEIAALVHAYAGKRSLYYSSKYTIGPQALIKESRDEVTLAKVSSQLHSTYEAASALTEFVLKKILIDKMEKSESYMAAPEHRDCYDILKKSYDLDKDLFFSYDVYSLKRSRKDKDKDEDQSAGSDRGLKKRKLSKYAEPTTGPKKKGSTSGSSKGTKSQPKSSRKSVQSEEPVFKVADLEMPQDQEGNLGDNED